MWKTRVTLALLTCVQVCAHGPMHPRVAGGVEAEKKAWPWMVSLHDPTCHFCGGSLISREWVLSAAHCFTGDDYDVDMDDIRVYLGKMTQRKKNWNEVVKYVEEIYIHNSYNATTFDNDIALLHLSSVNLKKKNFFKNKYIQPVSLLANGSDFPPGTSSQIIGWGQIANEVNAPYPARLREAVLSVVDHTQCQNQLTQLYPHLPHLQITNNMICAGVPRGCVDAGTGDSGGPMVSQHCSQWVQFGITSWGIGCGNPNMPGVYTRVSQYQQWITTTIQNHPSQDLPQFVNLNNPCPQQWSPTLLLEIYRPEDFSSNPNQTHMDYLIKVFRAGMGMYFKYKILNP